MERVDAAERDDVAFVVDEPDGVDPLVDAHALDRSLTFQVFVQDVDVVLGRGVAEDAADCRCYTEIAVVFVHGELVERPSRHFAFRLDVHAVEPDLRDAGRLVVAHVALRVVAEPVLELVTDL